MNHPAPSMIHARLTVLDYLLQDLSIHGREADRIIDATPATVPPPGWRRSFAINEFARAIAAAWPILEHWQADGAARYLMTYNPTLDAIPALAIHHPTP
jgi:hypothetical protein